MRSNSLRDGPGAAAQPLCRKLAPRLAVSGCRWRTRRSGARPAGRGWRGRTRGRTSGAALAFL
eukprot:1055492-Pyramimonas_sp.AAC.1